LAPKKKVEKCRIKRMMGPHSWSSFSSYPSPTFEIHYLNNYGKCEQNEEVPDPLEEF
jgi:hypothetical protein